MERANSFANLSDFDVKPKRKPVDPTHIEEVAHQNGFHSRPVTPARPPAAVPSPPVAAPAAPVAAATRGGRRYTTGRNKQIGLKVTDEAAELMYRLADEERLPMGEIVFRALQLYERSKSNG